MTKIFKQQTKKNLCDKVAKKIFRIFITRFFYC